MSEQYRNIDVEIAHHEKAIKLLGHLEKLEKNKDFKALIEEAFLKDFALEMVMQRGLNQVNTHDKMVATNLRKIDAVGEFANYLRNIRAMGVAAQNKLPELKALEDQIRAEED